MTEHIRDIPVSIESEQAVIGAALEVNGSFQKIARLITTGDFYDPVHRQIWEVVSALIEKGEIANITTTAAYLGDEEIRGLEGVTPRQYLAKLIAEAPRGDVVLSHARLVHSMAARRAMISLADEIQHLAYDLPVTTTVEQVFASMEKRMEKIRPMVAIDDEGFVPFGDVSIQDVLDAYKNGDVTTGLSTGIEPLDEKLGGLQDTDLIILAGRPGSGKTALSTNIAVNVAKQLHAQWPEGKRNGVVGFFSLEMGGGQLKNRILSSEAGIPFWKIRRNKMDRDEADRYVNANRDLQKLPLVIDQTGGLSVAQVAIRARQLKRRSGLRLLVIDYLQLLSGTKQHDSRSFEVTEITGKLKALAKELEVPIIALSQLSRKVEERDDKRPMLSDLRESGSIEQDADSVVFVYREEYYLKDREPKNNQGAWAAWRRSMDLVENTAELIIGKNRHGGAGWCEVGFIKEFTRFESEPPPKPIQPEDAQRAERDFVPTKVGKQVQDILKGLMLLKSEPPTDEHRGQDKRLSVGARVIPLDDCLQAFKDQCYPLLSEAALRTKFSEGMNNLREGRVARYSKCGDRHFCWMPGLASE